MSKRVKIEETYEETKARHAAEAEARRAKYAAIPTMEALQEYVKQDVERRMTQEMPKLPLQDDAVGCGRRKIHKTTHLTLKDFDEEIRARAAELYAAAHPEREALCAEKEAELVAEKEKIAAKIQEYIRLRDEMQRVERELGVLCSYMWRRSVEEYEITGKVCTFGSGTDYKLKRRLEDLRDHTTKLGFVEMVQTAQEGRKKVKVEDLRYI
jgi:hypothetical protein